MVQTRAQAQAQAHRGSRDGAPSSPSVKARKQTKLQESKRARASVSNNHEDVANPVVCWVKQGHWPSEYTFATPEMGPQSVLRARIEELADGEVTSVTDTGQTSGGDLGRETKCIPYKSATYPTKLEEFESFMNSSEQGVSPGSRLLCKYLLEETHNLPDAWLLNAAVFKMLHERVRYRNEGRVLKSITPWLVPSAEELAFIGLSGEESAEAGLSELRCLVESVNEGWTNCIPLTRPRPQPDYSVGFGRQAYTADQLARLRPLIGDRAARAQSFYMATYYMFFPFLTCEVKCGAVGLSIADNQNAHSMTLAVRGVVRLFRRVNREQELSRRILAFSISHDHSQVNLYGHYAEIDGEMTKYYRHTIKEFRFTNDTDRWTTYHFTKTIYINWMPQHLDLLCSAIDMLPLLNESDFETLPVSSKSNGNSTPDTGSDSFSACTPSSDDTSSNEPNAGKKNKRKRREQHK